MEYLPYGLNFLKHNGKNADRVLTQTNKTCYACYLSPSYSFQKMICSMRTFSTNPK